MTLTPNQTRWIRELPHFLDGGPYDLAYVDCPWPYSDTRTHASAGMARSAYSVMSIEDLVRLDVGSIMAKRSAIAMWWTGPKAGEARYVAQSWGFEVVTMKLFSWVKLNPTGYAWQNTEQGALTLVGGVYKGLGHYTRANTEDVLLAVRGTPRLTRHDLTVSQVVFAPRGRHSAKPPEVRARLERLFGPVRRIELFARERVEGWDGWGLEYPAAGE